MVAKWVQATGWCRHSNEYNISVDIATVMVHEPGFNTSHQERIECMSDDKDVCFTSYMQHCDSTQRILM